MQLLMHNYSDDCERFSAKQDPCEIRQHYVHHHLYGYLFQANIGTGSS